MKDLELLKIEEELEKKPCDYQLYEKYGKKLLDINRKQAYLCFENAAFLCADNNERRRILEYISSENRFNGAKSKVAIVILSFNLVDMTRECIESIRETTPETARTIVVVDNGSTDGSVEYLREQSDVVLVENKENQGFPRGCNQGIEAASEDEDILLLNNDTVMCFNTLFWLRMGLYNEDEHGIAGSVTNRIIAAQEVYEKDKSLEEYRQFALLNNRFNANACESRYFVTGFCMLIKRDLIKRIGVLDEKYGLGNFEDNDYCLRAYEAGYDCVVVHNSFLVHWGSKSFGKRDDYWKLIAQNRTYFESKFDVKWGSYDQCDEIYTRVKAINETNNLKDVLTINCGKSPSIMRLKWEMPDINFRAVDINNYDEKSKVVSDVIFEQAKKKLNDRDSYDAVIVDLRAQENCDFSVYLKAISLISSSGKIVIIVNNSKYHERWLPIAMGVNNAANDKCSGVSSANEFDSILNKNGYRVETWIYLFGGNCNDEQSKTIDGVAKALGVNAKDFLIRHFTVIASRW